MDFYITKEEIVSSLNATLGVVEKRQTLPILANVLFEVDESTLRLTATDLDASSVLSYGVNSVSNAGNLRNSFNTTTTSSTAGTYGQLSIHSSTGAYTYTPNSSAINNLDDDQTVLETFEIFVSDGSEIATRSFDIQITGAALKLASSRVPFHIGICSFSAAPIRII